MPYFYFSSQRAGNDYFGAHQAPSALNLTNNTQVNPSTSWVSLTPYYLSTIGTNPTVPRYVNPNSFQIICAGRDGGYGTGAQNWAGFNSGNGSADGAGYDNYSNFHPVQLGIPAQ